MSLHARLLAERGVDAWEDRPGRYVLCSACDGAGCRRCIGAGFLDSGSPGLAVDVDVDACPTCGTAAAACPLDGAPRCEPHTQDLRRRRRPPRRRPLPAAA